MKRGDYMKKSDMDQDVGRVMDIKTVCSEYKVSRRAVENWFADGLPRHPHWVGRKRFWRVYKKEVDTWLEEHRARHIIAVAEAGAKARKRIHDKWFVNYPLPKDVK